MLMIIIMWQNNKLETKINCEDDSDNVTLKMIIQYGNCDDDDLVAVMTLFMILLFKVIMFMKLTMLIIKAVIMTMMTIITTKDDGDVIMIPPNLMAKVVLMPV